MGRILVIISLLLIALGWAGWSLRAASGGRVLGHVPGSALPVTAAAVRQNPGALAGKIVSLSGRMTQSCPTAGCWFYLNDGTGELRVDARPGNFSVLGLPAGARLTAFGKIVREPGEDPQLEAVGVRS